MLESLQSAIPTEHWRRRICYLSAVYHFIYCNREAEARRALSAIGAPDRILATGDIDILQLAINLNIGTATERIAMAKRISDETDLPAERLWYRANQLIERMMLSEQFEWQSQLAGYVDVFIEEVPPAERSVWDSYVLGHTASMVGREYSVLAREAFENMLDSKELTQAGVARTHHEIGRSFIHDGDLQNAIVHFKRCLEFEDVAECKVDLARTYIGSEELDLAWSILQSVEESTSSGHPLNTDIALAMASLAIHRSEHLPGAIERLAALTDLQPFFRAAIDGFQLRLVRLQNMKIGEENEQLRSSLLVALSNRPFLRSPDSLMSLQNNWSLNDRFSGDPVSKHSIDFLILTATDVETAALLAEFRPERPVVRHGETRSYYDFRASNGLRVACVQSEPGSATPGGSMATVLAIVRELTPKYIVAAGVAFGARKQPIGTILVSKDVRFYEPARIGMESGSDKRIQRGSRVPASASLLSRFRAAYHSFRETSKSDVQFGLLLSGEKLIDNVHFRDGLLEDEPEALGGEMEAAGLFAAAHEGKLDWLIVKAVCDYADGNKSKDKKRRQKIAAGSAMAFLGHAIRTSS